jgi:hypothetical protein
LRACDPVDLEATASDRLGVPFVRAVRRSDTVNFLRTRVPRRHVARREVRAHG